MHFSVTATWLESAPSLTDNSRSCTWSVARFHVTTRKCMIVAKRLTSTQTIYHVSRSILKGSVGIKIERNQHLQGEGQGHVSVRQVLQLKGEHLG